MTKYIGCKFLNPLGLLSDEAFMALDNEDRYSVTMLNHLLSTCPVELDTDKIKRLLRVEKFNTIIVGQFFVELSDQSAAKMIAKLNKVINKNEVVKEYNDSESVFPFKTFWETYGKCADRRWCEIRYQKIKEEDRAKIKVHLPRYVASTPDKSFRKDPLKYLAKMAWDNEIVMIAPSFQKPAAPELKRLA